MRLIHKFKLSADTLQTLELPKYSTVLSVKKQYEQIVLYAAIDPKEMATEGIEIMILGTGQRTSTGKMYKFLDTVILAGANKWLSNYDGITSINKSGTITDYFLEVQYRFLELGVEIKRMELEPATIKHLYSTALDYFNHLGDKLGFTWEQIEQAYLDKNKVNHERQENGY